MQDIRIKKKHCMKSPTPGHSVQSVFFKSNTQFVLLNLQIKYQGQANHDTTFENSEQRTSGINTSTILLTSQGFIFKYISLHDWQLIYPLTLHVEQCPNKFTQNNLCPTCHEKLPSILYGAGHYALAPLKNLVGVYPSIIARKCRIKLAKILKLAKRIIKQNRSVSLCIIEELDCSHLKSHMVLH